MSSETAPAPSAAAEATTAESVSAPSSDGVKATTEANTSATDPNASLPLSTNLKTDADIDTMAADATAEGAVSGAAVVAPDSSSTPATAKKGKDTKRRSSGVPEHKTKKSAPKKKEVVLNLECQPGDHYFARLKGYPEWPSIIADEDMLPDAILGSRPVTARRPDYTYREDYADGGKHVKDRNYPIMFLGTNEFSWIVNTDLRKLEPEDVANTSHLKASKKSLISAYEIAKAQHDLAYFRNIILDFENARAEEERLAEEKAAAPKAAPKAKDEAKGKKGKRKSLATDEEDDDADKMDVDDAEAEGSKPSKKRKKSGVEMENDEKPAKTPKIKLNSTKPANGDATKGKSKTKSSKSKDAAPEAPAALSEAEIKDKRQKNVLYLRHKLQKGFLQEKAPQESDMTAMAAHFETLQQYKVLEPDIIRTTKIHKVLKTILRLDNVPFDDKYSFAKQSKELLAGWNQILAEEENGGGVNGNGNGTKMEESTIDGPSMLESKEEDGDESMANGTTEETGKTKGADESGDEPAGDGDVDGSKAQSETIVKEGTPATATN